MNEYFDFGGSYTLYIIFERTGRLLLFQKNLKEKRARFQNWAGWVGMVREVDVEDFEA